MTVGMSFHSPTARRVVSKTAERPHAAGLPVAHALDRVVHGRVDMLADEVHADLAAALEGHVGELGAGDRLLELDREDLVFLRASRCRPSALAALALLALLRP